MNDWDFYRWKVEKKIVPKGEEFVAFEIGGMDGAESI